MKKETIRTIFFTVIIIIGSVWFIRFFIIEPYRITPGQMENSLLPGDRLWVDKWSFRWGNRNPKYRDVLVFELPEIAQTQSGVTEIAIARCIGLPGDTIKSTGNKLFVNHKPVAQPPLILEAYLSPDSLEHRVNRMMRQNNSFFVEQGKLKDSRLLFLSRYDYEKVRRQLSADSLLYPVFLKRDFYEVLGISKTASADEIKRAYRKKAKQYHPDICKEPDAEEKFKEVQEAYEVLSDDNKRAAYDRYGHAAFEQGAGGAGAGGFGGFGFEDVDLGDIFGSFFGGGGSRRQRQNGPRRGDDHLMRLEIDFMDAINGIKKDIKVTYDAECSHCHGSGAKTPNDVQTCSHCNGTGTVSKQQQSPFGTFVTQTTCPHCNGTGKEIKVKCPDCHGKGYINKTVTVQLDIPAGINDGQQLRVAGKGGRGANGGPNGDLFVEIRVRNNTHFVREGRNIHMTIPISSIDATLGCEVDVPTVQGDVKVKIPAGTQSGTTLRLKGKGVKDLRGSGYGDQMVKVDVKIPTKLSSKEKSLYEQLQKLNKKESIFDSFKKQFKK